MKQEYLVMDYLRKHDGITQKEASDRLGVTRLAAVIWKLRHKYGFVIEDKTESCVNRWGVTCTYKRYYLP